LHPGVPILCFIKPSSKYAASPSLYQGLDGSASQLAPSPGFALFRGAISVLSSLLLFFLGSGATNWVRRHCKKFKDTNETFFIFLYIELPEQHYCFFAKNAALDLEGLGRTRATRFSLDAQYLTLKCKDDDLLVVNVQDASCASESLIPTSKVHLSQAVLA
jgi:hypothetical protein